MAPPARRGETAGQWLRATDLLYKHHLFNVTTWLAEWLGAALAWLVAYATSSTSLKLDGGSGEREQVWLTFG